MKSKTFNKILSETPDEIKEFVRKKSEDALLLTKKNKMILKKVTRESDRIYKIIYVSGIFKTHKSAKVYSWVGDWRFYETGKYLPYSLGTSLTTIAQGLKVGDSFYTKSSK